ncbi:hypothetical protein [uncultured Methanosphaera sp.]|uniref:hypothetical protein n=1 Tax=uncultured Methanosphaera sp. TaxID=262501 RepID=UPI0025925D75|nr:hypothetical protein [uncultured Methanosphaera sp.]
MAANVDSTNTQQQNSIIENTHETHDIQVLNEKNMEKQVIKYNGDKKSLKEVKVDNINEYKSENTTQRKTSTHINNIKTQDTSNTKLTTNATTPKKVKLDIYTQKSKTTNTTIKFLLKDTNNKSVQSGYFQVYEKNQCINSAKVVNGSYIFTTTPKAGIHTYTIKYNGSNLYQSINLNKTVKVVKDTVSMDIYTQKSSTINTTIKLVFRNSNKKSVSLGDIYVYNSKGVVVNNGVIKNGTYYIHLTSNSGLQKYTIKYLENSIYKPVQITKSVNIVKERISMDIYTLSTLTTNTTIKLVIRDSQKKPVNTGQISLTEFFGYSTIENVTNGYCYIRPLAWEGNKYYTIKYLENDLYKSAQIYKTININREESGMDIYTQSALTTNTTIKLIIRNSHKNTINFGEIEVKDKYGNIIDTQYFVDEAYIYLTPDTGLQQYTITYTGDNTYKPCSIVKKINVLKESVNVDIYTQSTLTTNTTIKLEIRDSNKKPVNQGKIEVTEDDFIVDDGIVENGEYYIKLKPTQGQHIYQITYTDNQYKTVTLTETINVSKRVYYVHPYGNDNGEGTKNNPYKTINKALSVIPDGHTIKLLGGTYTQSNIPKTLIINKNINIENEKGSVVKITVKTLDTIFKISKNANITGLNFEKCENNLIINTGNSKIKNCNFTENINLAYNEYNVSGLDEPYYYGASIINNTGTLSINNSIFKENEGRGYGGAIRSMKGSIFIANSKFDGNYIIPLDSTSNGGGVLYLRNSKANIYYSIFTNNEAINGGATLIEGSNVTITKSTFNKNNARSGGAININIPYYEQKVPKSKVSITNSNFINNICKNGGSIYNDGTLNITNCTAKNNQADYGSGGGFLYNEGNVIIRNSNINNNNASFYGGAISNNGTLTIISSNILNNKVTEHIYENNSLIYALGGGIYCLDGTVKILNSKINNNNAHAGGAIAVKYGNITITNSQLNNNKACYGGAVSKSDEEYEYSGTGLSLDDDYEDEYIETPDFNITITNTQINNNYAKYDGGAIYNEGYVEGLNGFLEIINSQINNNEVVGYNEYWFIGNIICGDDLTFIKNSNITNNHASNTVLTNIKILNNSLIKNNKAEQITCNWAGGTITHSTFQNNTASETIICSRCGQGSGLSKLAYCNFIGNKGYLVTEKGYSTELTIENNYWGSSNPNWSKILKNIKKPTKYYKYKI